MKACIPSRALHFSCDKLIPPSHINFIDLPVLLSMKTLSLYVHNKDTQRTIISASPDGDHIRTFFSMLLERYSMVWAITFVSAPSWFDKNV